MSSGQKPRTPEFFPKMKVRGMSRRERNRKRHPLLHLSKSFKETNKALQAFGEAVVNGIAAIGSFVAAVNASENREREQAARITEMLGQQKRF